MHRPSHAVKEHAFCVRRAEVKQFCVLEDICVRGAFSVDDECAGVQQAAAAECPASDGLRDVMCEIMNLWDAVSMRGILRRHSIIIIIIILLLR